MTINSIAELEKIMRLCRKHKIQSIKIDNIEFKLDDSALEQPVKRTKTAYKQFLSSPAVPDAIDTPDALSEEDLLFYSATNQVQTEAN